MNFTCFYSIICATLLSTPVAIAHEFWIEPVKFQVEKGDAILADLRNGQFFAGNSQPFFENRNTRLNVTMGAQTTPILGRMGDRPAIQLEASDQDGLMILTHEAAPAILTYREWAKFVKFVEHKDFENALTQHAKRNLPQEGFKETYTRHSKSLIAVGNGTGNDRELGLATEFILHENPYSTDFDGTLDISLLYNGAPRRNAQIEVYARDQNDEVVVALARTDNQGRAMISVQAGMDYLLDAVVLRAVDHEPNEETGPVWESLWATVTFAVPPD